MKKIKIYDRQLVQDESVRFVTAAARYKDKWVFSRHKLRTTWDMPGGHREVGETLHDAMERELWEETGAIEAQIQPLSVYGVDGDDRYGMLFFADIKELGELPTNFEMAEISLTDALPRKLTYPEILPALFEYVQGWLNRQCSTEELWDVYDGYRNLTGKKHRRGDSLGEGEYHLVVHVWVEDADGKFLLTKRSPNKGFPNLWETTGGSALAGEDSLTAALREVREETGLTLDTGSGRKILSVRKEDCFRDVWLFRHDFNIEDIVLLPGETTDKICADAESIRKMWQTGELVPYDYLDELF